MKESNFEGIRSTGLSGLELAKRLMPGRKEMRILYVSGYADHETAKRTLGDPTVAYLQKPFAPAEFARRVEETISRARRKSNDR